jgi:hypothetical protein
VVERGQLSLPPSKCSLQPRVHETPPLRAAIAAPRRKSTVAATPLS